MSQNAIIKNISIYDPIVSKKKLLEKFVNSYRKKKNFKKNIEFVSNIILHDEENLSKYIFYSIKKISEFLKIKTKICFSSDINNQDKKNGASRIMQITKSLKGSCYINLPGGTQLYDKDEFYNNSIKLEFLNTELFMDNYASVVHYLFEYDKDEIITMID